VATVAELQARLGQIDDKLLELRLAPDIVTRGPDGGEVTITRGSQIAMLQKERATLAARLCVKQGSTSAEAQRIGVDVARATDNGDLP